MEDNKMIKRTVGKVSVSNPTEGVRNLIASVYGIDPSEVILPQNLIDGIKQMEGEKIKIMEIIGSFYDELEKLNTKDANKKKLELIDLGKFIYYSKQEQHIRIIECDERPDFVIELDGERIGIEHTGIYDDSTLAEINNTKKLLKKCEEKLKNDRVGITGLFNVSINLTKVKEKVQMSDADFIQTICDSVISKFENAKINLTYCIDNIVYTNHTSLEIILAEDYWLKQLSGITISNAIKKKEKKIEEYKV